MKELILILQVITSVAIIACILLQAKGTGLGSTFGGSGEFYSTKRGVEKIVFIATIVLGILFTSFSFILLLI